MADDVKQPAAKAADLARVRDNQRRSRARRKEYLHELETKYRTCEQVGIGATAEIQAAARQVAEENRRLRQILRRHGISTDDEEGENGVDQQISSSAVVGELEAMIGRKRTCGGGGGSGGGDGGCSGGFMSSSSSSAQDFSQIPDRGGGLRPLQSRAAVGRQLSPASSNTSATGRGRGMSSPMSGSAPQQQQQFQPAYTMGLDTTYDTQQQQHHPQQQQQQQQQQQTSPPSLYGSYDYQPPPQQQQHHHQQLTQPFDQDFYPHPQTMDSSTSYTSQTTHHHQHQQQPSNNNNNNSSSCRDIAAAIRYVRPTISQHDLEREMGCQPGASDGEAGSNECHVPNYEAFDLMDRLGHG